MDDLKTKEIAFSLADTEYPGNCTKEGLKAVCLKTAFSIVTTSSSFEKKSLKAVKEVYDELANIVGVER